MATTGTPPQPRDAGAKSLVMHSAARHYDLLAWLLTLGRERALRERLVELARLAPGEIVLDVGCGTGSLAVVAKGRVGPAGRVTGIDASPEMIAQARTKAARAGLDIRFDIARAEALPLPDGSVDVVLSTLMLHHLPAKVRERFAGEIRRVLKPTGRVLAVDFEPPAKKRGGLISQVHRHGHVPLREITALLERAGLRVQESGAVGASDLKFTVATAPDALEMAPRPALPPLPLPPWIWLTGGAALIAIHLLVLRMASTALVLSGIGLALLAALLVAHVGAAGGVHRLLKRH
jgi:ubiquinone/menaquinone biosynthesis C-methylase UbiE